MFSGLLIANSLLKLENSKWWIKDGEYILIIDIIDYIIKQIVSKLVSNNTKFIKKMSLSNIE